LLGISNDTAEGPAAPFRVVEVAEPDHEEVLALLQGDRDIGGPDAGVVPRASLPALPFSQTFIQTSKPRRRTASRALADEITVFAYAA
jgi:hypothetical protein